MRLEVALHTNPDTVARLVDHGPSADEQDEAAKFRNFWGEKAELRRFKDGSISEALVWSLGSPVTLQVIAYLAVSHFKMLPSSIKTSAQNLESSILGDDESSSVVSPADAFRVINSDLPDVNLNTSQSRRSSLTNPVHLPSRPSLALELDPPPLTFINDLSHRHNHPVRLLHALA